MKVLDRAFCFEERIILSTWINYTLSSYYAYMLSLARGKIFLVAATVVAFALPCSRLCSVGGAPEISGVVSIYAR
jgi:hypothetical protein